MNILNLKIDIFSGLTISVAKKKSLKSTFKNIYGCLESQFIRQSIPIKVAETKTSGSSLEK